MHQKRRSRRHDCDARFARLSRLCAVDELGATIIDTGTPVQGYGIDPAFNERSPLFDPTVSNAPGDFYNQSTASGEVNAQGVPHAFFPRALTPFSAGGFPVIFLVCPCLSPTSVSYTHLTLPTKA